MNENGNIIKNTYSSYLSQIISVFSGFTLSILLVRYLSKAEFGAYSFINSSLVFLAIFVSFGIESVVSRYVAEFITTKESAKLKKLLLFSISIRLTCILVVSAIVYINKLTISKYFNLEPILIDSMILILAIHAISNVRPLIGTAFLQATLEIYKDKINIIIYQLLKVTVFGIALLMGYGLLQLLVCWLVIEVVSLIIYLFSFANKMALFKENKPSKNFSSYDKRRITQFAGFNFLAVSAFIFLDFAVDNLIIAHYLSLEAVALYSLGVAIITLVSKFNPIMLMRGMISTILVKKYTITKDKEYVERSFNLMLKICVIATIPLYIQLVIYAEKIITFVYKPEYLGALVVIYTLAGLYFFKELTHAFNPLINAMEKSEIFFFAAIFSLYNLIMDIILVPKYGVFGAAIATGSSAFLLFFYYLIMFSKYVKLNLKFPFVTIMRVLRNLLPSIIFSYMTISYVTNIWNLVFVLFGYLAIYLIVSVRYKILSTMDRDIMNNILGRKLVFI